MSNIGYEIQPWWRRWIIDWRFKEEDENNRSGFYFKFLNVTIWDMMVFEFAVELRAGVEGAGVAISLPFLRIHIGLLPRLDRHHKTWRTQRFPCGWSIIERRNCEGQGLGLYDLHDRNDSFRGTFTTKKEALKAGIRLKKRDGLL